ncbi:MAG TPA: hypothetical protein PKW08_03735 [Flavobacteriaceae bacterium]|nr:hypothetical protein [Flavobacteriaceae bacterium]HQU20676.1 hypothetical protein [Flavobacteriaceae bacterium]HQU64906.1 hypothetical protein [Flavobacteriaceae bacterium]HRW43898.1 hypothetical protein [Flavobacteriaceae bacterium]
MSTTTTIIIIIIVLHLVFGFGWLVYKLAPRKEDRDDESDAQQNQ